MMNDRYLPAPDGLRVNLLVCPVGVDRQDLRFSWVDHAIAPDWRQSAYRLAVARGTATVFDTGWVNDNNNTGIRIPGLSDVLEDNALYRWTVTVRGEDGVESLPSEPQVLATAVGTRWISTRGLWARQPGADAAAEDVFCFLRHEFFLTGQDISSLDRAILTATARSPEPSRQFVYNLSLNGRSVGLGPARYGTSPTDERLLYCQSYDVTSLLTSGVNCVGTICYALAEKLFLCQMTLFFRDGTAQVVINSGRDADMWFSLPGDTSFRPSNSIGTGYYKAHANNLDATVYPIGFDRPGFDASGWTPAFLCVDMVEDITPAPTQTDPVNRFPAPAEAIRITLCDKDDPAAGQRIDFGRELIGGFGLTVTADAPTDIDLAFGEELDGVKVKSAMNTGNVYRETWRLRSGETILDSIDMMCYRYVMITGCPVALTADCIRGWEIRTPFRDGDASLVTDHPLLDRLYELTRHTIKVTTQDLYVDSQSRERGAYEGDLLINQLAATAFTADASVPRFTAEYLYTHRTWPAEYILYTVMAARYDYLYTGDDRSLRTWYPLLRQMNFSSCLDRDTGLLILEQKNASSMNAILVDWPGTERDGYDMSVACNTVLNAVAVRGYADLAEIARWTDHAEDAAVFDTLAHNLRKAMIRRLYRPEAGCFVDGLADDGTPSPHASQHATAYALACGVYDSPAMADRMAQHLEAQGNIRMSVFGAFFLLEGLYATGHGDAANRLMLNPDITEGARTWAYMLDVLHATVTTEAWNRRNKGNMTLSHPWGAAPAYAITAGIFGIRPTAPGFAAFEVCFCPGMVGKASLSLPTVRGVITAAFDATDPKSFRAVVTAPANTAATVRLPETDGARVVVSSSDKAM